MAKRVDMPKMGYDMTEGKISRWIKQEGEPVAVGDAIAEIETDKVNIEIEAFDAGVLKKIVRQVGDIVPVGERDRRHRRGERGDRPGGARRDRRCGPGCRPDPDRSASARRVRRERSGARRNTRADGDADAGRRAGRRAGHGWRADAAGWSAYAAARRWVRADDRSVAGRPARLARRAPAGRGASGRPRPGERHRSEWPHRQGRYRGASAHGARPWLQRRPPSRCPRPRRPSRRSRSPPARRKFRCRACARRSRASRPPASSKRRTST